MGQTYEVPGWGVGEVWVRGRTVLLHALPGEVAVNGTAADGRPATLGGASHAGSSATPPEGASRPPEGTLPGAATPDGQRFVADLCRRFSLHLHGVRVAYDDLQLDMEGRTPFELDLCHALRSVPWGEVVSYGELAALAGRPGAARAAGAFCASSDVALVVPCHRVVAAHGIGGYGQSGVALKRRLLELEGVSL